MRYHTHDHDVEDDVIGHYVCLRRIDVLERADIDDRLATLPNWELRGGHLHRQFHCATFTDSMSFVDRIGRIAEADNHHPHFAVSDKRLVDVEIWTHQLDGLTTLDFQVATEIDTAFIAVSCEARR